MVSKTLYLTCCARRKNEGEAGPEDMYISRRIGQFIETCKSQGLPWVILSAKYGLFLPEEKKLPYDVTFVPDDDYESGVAVAVSGEKLSKPAGEKYVQKWVKKIKTKADNNEFGSFVFFAPDAEESEPYLNLLRAAVGNRVELIKKF